MRNFTPEWIAKAKAAKSAEELLALAKENNVELTEEEAKTYFEQLNANGGVSDDELDAVAGGFLGCGEDSEEEETVKVQKKEEVPGASEMRCPVCRAIISVGSRACSSCHKIFRFTVNY